MGRRSKHLRVLQRPAMSRARKCGFCLSKARDREQQLADERDVVALSQPPPDKETRLLRDELSELKLRQLSERAVTAGVTAEAMDQAEEAEDYRSALIDLIVAKEHPAERGLGGAAAAEQQAAADIGGADELGELVHELEGLKLLALSRRALSTGVDAESVEEAMDADDGRSALIALIVNIESSRGPAERMVSALEGGGEASADIVIGVLDHTMSVLEHLSVSCARKSRKVVRALLERTEAAAEVVDAEWCDGVSLCSVEDLETLGSLLISAQGVSVEGHEVSEVSSAVDALLDCMSRCGSTVLQSVSTLMRSRSDDAEMSGSALLGALESLRGLSESRLESVCADEAAA